MRILYVCRTFPYPEDDGEKVRESTILKLLCRNNEIHMLVLSKNDVSITNDLNEFVSSINFIKIGKKFKRLTLLPKYVSYYSNTETKRKIQEFLLKNKFDCIYIRSAYLLPYFKDTSKIKDKKTLKIADLTDSNILYFKRKIKEQKNIIDKIKTYIILMKTIRYESEITKQFDGVVLISEHDRNLIKTNYNKLKVIPDYIPDPYFKKSKIKEKNELIFFGSFYYDENKRAVGYFLKHIFPALQKEIKDINLVLVGKGSKQYTNIKGISAKGYIPNLKKELDSAKIFICPLLNGAGTKSKVLKAMATGKAIVTTPIGIEGIPVKHNKHIMVARDPEQFTESIIRLLKNSNLRRKLGKEAKKLAKKEYSHKVIQKKVNCLLKEAKK